MAKTQLIKMDGVITDDLSNCKYKVVLDNGKELIAYVSGKMRKNNIRVMPGDSVTIEISPYDLDNGRIVYRKKVTQDENTEC